MELDAVEEVLLVNPESAQARRNKTLSYVSPSTVVCDRKQRALCVFRISWPYDYYFATFSSGGFGMFDHPEILQALKQFSDLETLRHNRTYPPPCRRNCSRQQVEV